MGIIIQTADQLTAPSLLRSLTGFVAQSSNTTQSKRAPRVAGLPQGAGDPNFGKLISL